MLWGGSSREGRTKLVEVIGQTTADRHIENIIQDHVLPYVGYIGYEKFVLLHEIAQPHAAGIVTNYLDSIEIQTLDWPPHSPELNLVGHVWDELKRRIGKRNPVPSTIEELRFAAQYEWNANPQEYIQSLFSSMPRRMHAVITGQGGNTRY